MEMEMDMAKGQRIREAERKSRNHKGRTSTLTIIIDGLLATKACHKLFDELPPICE